MKKTHVTILGVGLLGGSLAAALKRRGGYRLSGWSPSAATRRKARRLMRVADFPEKAVAGADVVVIGAPSAAVVPLLRKILPLVKSSTLVLDMASVKGAVARAAARIPGVSSHFVPCHPMAGKERSGVDHADPDLYRDRLVFLTPLPGTPRPLIRRAVSLWQAAGASVRSMDPRRHDERVALTSHLPHLLACVLTERYGQAIRRDRGLGDAVGTGFRDVTRIAASSPDMWTDIVELNAGPIRRNLAAFRRRLSLLERDLRPGRRTSWHRFFSKVRSVREALR